VKRTTVRFPTPVAAAIDRVASETETPASEVIRRAVVAYLGVQRIEAETPRPDLAEAVAQLRVVRPSDVG
jgi:hypothetical protein